jgi:hypothetical protein
MANIPLFWLAKAALFFSAVFLLLPAGWAQDQTKLFQATETRNRAGSDDSLKNSTAYAMNALMDLSNLNIKSAVNNGMTAYGKYRNSETLDRLGDENMRRAASLASVGSSAVTEVKKTETTFRRLDPKFLREGKFAKVASEFEKRSGMPRETFLSQMSEISEKKISRSDPQLVNKVIGRFENFVAKIPNADFKAQLQQGVELVPASQRTGLISQAVSKFAATTPSLPADSAVSAASPAAEIPSALGAAEAAPSATEASDGTVAAKAPSADDRAPASAFEPNLNEISDTGVEEGSNPLGGIIQAAIDTQAQDLSLFQQITRRYRVLTPQLAKTP